MDLFSGVKHSYSTALPSRCGMVDLVVSADGQRSRFCGIARSGNMRLDPLDAPRIAYRRRKEINRAIAWGHFTGNILVMMTLTVPHRWSTLKAITGQAKPKRVTAGDVRNVVRTSYLKIRSCSRWSESYTQAMHNFVMQLALRGKKMCPFRTRYIFHL